MTVRIPVQAQWVVIPPGISILRIKPSGCAVIIARVQVVQPRLKVILVSGIENAVIHIPGLRNQRAERIIAVGSRRLPGCRIQQHHHIAVGIVQVRITLPARAPADQVQPVNVMCGNAAGSVRLIYDMTALVEVPGFPQAGFLPESFVYDGFPETVFFVLLSYYILYFSKFNDCFWYGIFFRFLKYT